MTRRITSAAVGLHHVAGIVRALGDDAGEPRADDGARLRASSALCSALRACSSAARRLGQIAPRVLEFLLRRDAVLDERGQSGHVGLRVLDVRLRRLHFRAPRRTSVASEGISKRTSRSPVLTRSPFGLRHLDDAGVLGRGDRPVGTGRGGHHAGRRHDAFHRLRCERQRRHRGRGLVSTSSTAVSCSPEPGRCEQ